MATGAQEFKGDQKNQTMKTETILLSEEKPLGSRDLKRLRHHATEVFKALERKIQSDFHNGTLPPSPWIGGESRSSAEITITDRNDNNIQDKTESTKSTEAEKETSFRKRYFDEYGFCVARSFCDAQETFVLKQSMEDSVRDNWFPEGTTTDDEGHEETKQEKVTSFGTDAKSNKARGDPFLESADKVSYFAEPTALDSVSGILKPEFLDKSKKSLALCKAGHGLHLPPSFRRIAAGNDACIRDEKKTGDTTNKNDDDDNKNIHRPFFEYSTSSKLRDLVLSLGWVDPVVPQSMYIFKNPLVGGVVGSHQDSTFLYTTPRQTCLGLWLALDDATLHNGCLWVRPKSHREPLRRQFLRNPKHQENEDEPKLTFQIHHNDPRVSWEGSLPPSVEVSGDVEEEKANTEKCKEIPPKEISSMNFVPVEVKAGDLLVFCGTLDHFSLPNFSDEQRHTFQLHLVEGPKNGIEWSPSNWLQYESAETKGRGFLRLLAYDNR